MSSGLSGQQRACHGTAYRPTPDEADPLHLLGMASRIEIATDAVDLVVTDCDVLTARAHERASMDAEYSGAPPRSGDSCEGRVDDFLTRGLVAPWGKLPAPFSGGPKFSARGASKRTRPELASATRVVRVSSSPARRSRPTRLFQSFG